MDCAKEGNDIVSGMGENEDISVCIFVCKEDVTCNNIVAEMFNHCKHTVLCSGGVLDVVHAIWEKKGTLDLVLTNVDKLGSSGPEIIKHIKETLRLPVLSISVDRRKIESRGQPFSFEAFVIYNSSLNNVKKLWGIALEKERGKKVAASQEEDVQRPSMSNISAENKTSPLIVDEAHSDKKSKSVDLSEGSAEDRPKTKKQRVAWTLERHEKFLEAIEILGYENAVPKKIVEVMNDPELTRENVASHLQKYRLCLKRAQEVGPRTMHSRNDFQGLSVASSFGSNLARRDYTSIEGILLSSRNGVGKLQQRLAPEVRFTPSFGIYEDQKRNMLLSIDNNNVSSNAGKFVGIQLTGDGKCVGYGNDEASNMINTESSQGHSVSTQKIGDEYPFNLDLSEPPSITSKQHVPLHPIGDSGNEEDTEKHCTLSDQDTIQSWETSATVVPFPTPSEVDILVQNEPVPLSPMFDCEKDFSIPDPVTPANDIPVAFLEGISEENYPQSPLLCFDENGYDGPLKEGSGSTSHQFFLEEIDDPFAYISKFMSNAEDI